MQKALTSLPWVKKAEVIFEKKQAVVTADAGRYDEKALLKVLDKAGYPARVVPPEGKKKAEEKKKPDDKKQP